MQLRARRLLILPLLLLNCALHGQSPVIQWQKTLGSFHGDYAESVRPTTDGGYIVAGYTEGADGDVEGYHGNIIIGDLWITKLSASGALQWQKCLGGVYQEVGADIRQTADGGYIVAGSSSSVDCGIPGNHGGLDFWLVKLSPAGDIQWQKMLGGSGNEYAESISPTADGGYIIGGYTSSSDGQVTGYHPSGGYSFDWWVVKVDASGNLIWEKALGGTGDDECYSVQATADGGCIAAGYVSSSDGDVVGNHGKTDAWVVKFDNTGAVQWKKAYGGSDFDQAASILVTSDGGYIFAGSTSSNDGDVSGNHQGPYQTADFWVVKTDGSGNFQWQKCYGGLDNEIAFYMQSTLDGGYVVTGSAESSDGDLTCNAGLDDAWIIKIGSTGSLQWSKSMGGNYYDQANAVQPLADGSFILAAQTCSIEVPGFHLNNTSTGSCGDFWIIKLSPPEATPPAPVVTLTPAAATVCAGLPAVFTATVMNSGVTPSYQWMRNCQVVGTNSPTYTASDFQDNDVLKVTVQAGVGVCDIGAGTATASITVHLNPTVLHPILEVTTGITFLCACSPASFSAKVLGGGTAPGFLWLVDGVIAGTNSPSFVSSGLTPNDGVVCEYFDSSGCIAGGSVKSQPVTLKPGTGGTVSVNISGPADSVCAGSPVNFTASPVNAGANPVYQWQVNNVNVGSNSSNYSSSTLAQGDVVTCTVTPDPASTCTEGGNANSNPITVQLTAKGNPSVSISAASDIVCKGDTASFKATALHVGANPTYQWEVNGVPAGTSGPGFSGAGFANGDVVQCVVTVDPTYTCALATTATSGTVALQVVNQANASVSISASPAVVCKGSTINFTATSQNAGIGPSYQWMVNGAPVGNDALVFGSNQLSDGAVVTCVMAPGTGACLASPVASNPVVADVEAAPVVTISPADTTVLSGRQVTMRAEVSSDVTSYQWAPANLLIDPTSLTSMTVPLQDSVLFTLTAVNADGCKTTAEGDVLIYRALVMPNAFTPNGDGVNDVFRVPPGIGVQLSEFVIYDRWGSRVFSSRNVSQGWDGTTDGHPAPAGIYVYLIIGSDLKGPLSAKGTVMLVR
jgi:gliding motility-associated-like protein